MFQVGDMVKILVGPERIGVVVEIGHTNGFGQWLKVMFFSDPAYTHRTASASKFAKVS